LTAWAGLRYPSHYRVDLAEPTGATVTTAHLDDPKIRAALFSTVSDLLYEPGDPRAEPRPSPAHLGQLRLWLGTLADEAMEKRS